jgi:hypothetical protein
MKICWCVESNPVWASLQLQEIILYLYPINIDTKRNRMQNTRIKKEIIRQRKNKGSPCPVLERNRITDTDNAVWETKGFLAPDNFDRLPELKDAAIISYS